MNNTTPYNVNGTIEHLTLDAADELFLAGVNITPVDDDDNSHDDGFDHRTIFTSASMGWKLR